MAQSIQEEALAADQAQEESTPLPEADPPVAQSMTPQQITFANKNSAKVIVPPPGTKAADIASALGLEPSETVILLLGGSTDLHQDLSAYLIQLFSRGIARGAADIEAAIIDSGRNSGITAMMGRGVADRGRRSPLIGVAPISKIIHPHASSVTPADSKEPLEPNHSHCVLVDGDEWGDETETMIHLAEHLAHGKTVVTIVVNGDETTKKQLLQAVRRYWPIIVIKDSGGVSDEIAKLWQTRPNFIPDPDLAEIIVDGNVHIFSLNGPISGFERLLDQLSSYHEGSKMDTLELAWKRFAMYDANANRQQARFNNLQTSTLILGVIATLLVIIQEQLRVYGVPLDQQIAWWLHFVILLLPITITFLIAINNRFSAGTKWIASRASAESIKKEIFRYRARAEIYSDRQTKKLSRDIKLTRKLDQISTKLMQTEVNTSAIRDYDGPIPPRYGAAEDDDGLSFLPPDRYLSLRLQDQLTYYRRKTVELERRLYRLQWIIYLAGAAGTLLVALNFELWIALTTSVATTIATYLEYQKIEEKLMRYNQTATDLANVQSWWAALSPEEQANPDNIDKLAGQTETTIHAEHAAWIQDMQDAMAELRAEQTADSSLDGSHSTEQKLITLKR